MTESTSAGASTSPPDLEEEFSQDPPDDGGAWEYAEKTPPPLPPFTVPGDVVTRLLCSTAHLKGGFADHVMGELVDPSHRAMPPNWNIDPVALVRHANQAQVRRSVRDLRLLLVFALVVGVVEIALGAMVTGHLAALHFIGLTILVLPLAWVAAFWIVWWHYTQIHRSTMAVIGAPRFDAVEPDPLPSEIEEVLKESREANVVLFSGGSPFVGSGELLDRWTITVDVSQGAEGQAPVEFDSAELHDAMMVAVPESTNPRPRAGHRLYVVGGHALAVGGLFRSGPVPENPVQAQRFRRPVSVVPDEMIRKYLNGPRTSARPYAFFELTAWDSQVVVTAFVRVVVTHPVLFAEVAVCALRPPQGRYGDVGTIRLGPGVHRWPIVRSVLPQTLPLLFFSPARAYRNLRGGRLDRLGRLDLEVSLEQRTDINFSAGPSMREEVARSENPLHFGYVDEEMFFRTLTRGVLDSLQDCLIDRRVDISEFSRQRMSIEERTTSKAHSIYGTKSD